MWAISLGFIGACLLVLLGFNGAILLGFSGACLLVVACSCGVV